jgi:hypothetical protein
MSHDSGSVPVDRVDLPPPPRSKDDGIYIFACEHPEGGDFCVTMKTVPKVIPLCVTCGRPSLHVGHDTVHRILARAGVL